MGAMSRPSLSGATSLGPNQPDEPGTPRDAGEGALQDNSGRGSASWGHASRGQAMTLLWASQVSRAAGEMGPRPFRSFIKRLDRWAASPDTLFSKATPSTDSSLADGDGTGTGCGLWGADRGRAVEAVRGFHCRWRLVRVNRIHLAGQCEGPAGALWRMVSVAFDWLCHWAASAFGHPAGSG